MGLRSLQKDELFPVSVETLYQLEFSRETGPRRCVYIHMYIGKENEEDYMYINLSVIYLRERLRSWQLWGLVSLKSVGQVGR